MSSKLIPFVKFEDRCGSPHAGSSTCAGCDSSLWLDDSPYRENKTPDDFYSLCGETESELNEATVEGVAVKICDGCDQALYEAQNKED